MGSVMDANRDELDPIGTDKVSYVNMVVGSNGLDEDVARVSGFIDKDVIIMQEDIILDQFGFIPSIQFSDRVHDQIDHNMRNALVVRYSDAPSDKKR
ncbi:hypothetical protein V6N11_028973 [Hibiscus sabdariffa]|uniref:Uncharacterized protein n=2 Tax=Hibiscus sabdariffa TaxID=183260 RepID=A0ABR2NW50_9ROSI